MFGALASGQPPHDCRLDGHWVVTKSHNRAGWKRLRSKNPNEFKQVSGAAEGIRTPDPIITNDVLYQLSYRGALGAWPARRRRCAAKNAAPRGALIAASGFQGKRS